MENKFILDLIMQYVNIPYLATFVLFSYGFIKMAKIDKLTLVIFSQEIKIRKTYIVLILALIIAVPFYFISEGSNNAILIKLILSYGLGTSFYEVFIKQLENIFNPQKTKRK